jgi:hypothetical protein|tara:strand:+ start:1156 stop:1506 length:351 start_codon:yes stop_codon:yes gene_type:complete
MPGAYGQPSKEKNERLMRLIYFKRNQYKQAESVEVEIPDEVLSVYFANGECLLIENLDLRDGTAMNTELNNSDTRGRIQINGKKVGKSVLVSDDGCSVLKSDYEIGKKNNDSKNKT